MTVSEFEVWGKVVLLITAPGLRDSVPAPDFTRPKFPSMGVVSVLVLPAVHTHRLGLPETRAEAGSPALMAVLPPVPMIKPPLAMVREAGAPADPSV